MLAEPQSSMSPINVLALLGLGGWIAQLIRIGYEVWQDRKRSARELQSKAVELRESVLHAADELAGKINDLAKEDFKELELVSADDLVSASIRTLALYSTYARFCASLAVFRQSRFLSKPQLSNDIAEVFAWLRMFEGREIRLVDRYSGQYIGERLSIESKDGAPLVAFLRLWQSDAAFRSAVQEIGPQARGDVVDKRAWRKWRQRVLVAGVLMIAMCERFDPDHRCTKPRRLHLNKLARASRELIRSILRRQHLLDREAAAKYYDGDGRFTSESARVGTRETPP